MAAPFIVRAAEAKKVKKLSLLILVSWLSIAASSAQSFSTLTARVSIRGGVVEVQRGNSWLPVVAGESLGAGERIRTGKASTVAIEIGTGRVVTVGELATVQIVPSSTGLLVKLEAGVMKQFFPTDLPARSNDTIAETPERQLILELRDQVEKLNQAIRPNAVPDEPRVIRTKHIPNQESVLESPAYVAYLDFLLTQDFVPAQPDPGDGRIVPPTVTNPTHPAYRPTQIVPPMPDPLRARVW